MNHQKGSSLICFKLYLSCSKFYAPCSLGRAIYSKSDALSLAHYVASPTAKAVLIALSQNYLRLQNFNQDHGSEDSDGMDVEIAANQERARKLT
jgi:hypothetical protein